MRWSNSSGISYCSALTPCYANRHNTRVTHYKQIAFITPRALNISGVIDVQAAGCVCHVWFGVSCVFTLNPADTVRLQLTYNQRRVTEAATVVPNNINQRASGVIVGLRSSLLSLRPACLPARIISSPGTMFTSWHRSMWTQ